MNTALIAIAPTLAMAALAAAAPTAPVETLTGVVVRVESATPAVVIEARGRTTRVAVDRDTKIIKSGSAIALDRLRRGDRVVVNFYQRAGNAVAVSIGVQERQERDA